MNRLLFTFFILFILSSCSEINTTDPAEVYKYWSGAAAPVDVHVIHGQYWESAHFTKEYEMYLKLKPTEKWWTAFVDQNQLVEGNNDWVKPTNAPKWFIPNGNLSIYSSGDDFDQGSRYFRDTGSNECYIYEIQF